MTDFNFKKILESPKDLLSRAGGDPYFDWAFILILSFAVAVVFIGIGARLFFRVSGEASASGNGSEAGISAGGLPAPSAGPSLDTGDLDNLISIFQSKNAQLPVFTAAYPGPSDPAIPLAAIKVPKTAASSSVPATGKPSPKTPAK